MTNTTSVPIEPKLELDAKVLCSQWTCIASSLYQGEMEVPVAADIGTAYVNLEIRLPRIVDVRENYFIGQQDLPNRKLAEILAMLLRGKLMPCTGGPFTNSWIIRVRIPVVDGEMQLDRRVDNFGDAE